MQCSNNLKQTRPGLHNYDGSQGQLPPMASSTAGRSPGRARAEVGSLSSGCCRTSNRTTSTSRRNGELPTAVSTRSQSSPSDAPPTRTTATGCLESGESLGPRLLRRQLPGVRQPQPRRLPRLGSVEGAERIGSSFSDGTSNTILFAERYSRCRNFFTLSAHGNWENNYEAVFAYGNSAGTQGYTSQYNWGPPTERSALGRNRRSPRTLTRPSATPPWPAPPTTAGYRSVWPTAACGTSPRRSPVQPGGRPAPRTAARFSRVTGDRATRRHLGGPSTSARLVHSDILIEGQRTGPIMGFSRFGRRREVSGASRGCPRTRGFGGGGQTDVSGEVTFSGKPIAGGRVTFVGQEGEKKVVSAPDSAWQVRHQGLPLRAGEGHGRKFPSAETESQRAPPKDLTKGFGPSADDDPEPNAPPQPYVPIPQRFNSPDTSGLDFTVKRDTKEHNLTLVP